ncbi:hypothetical protein [Mucilaginibacter glaciei]|uniref:Uncharacterized protein n=1 Tax=Mucilaginibacter glaciei TaxID=2772109 RepID=A0A926S6N3_9SPHI|nr:hypothetical protein [Mucilaginibacter glaciei]MBD1393896.1 hypothetical protein [Mucilaginibacter glaciei]
MLIKFTALEAPGAVWAKLSDNLHLSANIKACKSGPDDEEEEEGDSSGGTGGFTL